MTNFVMNYLSEKKYLTFISVPPCMYLNFKHRDNLHGIRIQRRVSTLTDTNSLENFPINI